MTVSADKEELNTTEAEPLPQQKDAVLEALGNGDELRLAELVESNESLRLYAERVITSVGPLSFSEIDVEEFDELRNALAQVEAAL